MVQTSISDASLEICPGLAPPVGGLEEDPGHAEGTKSLCWCQRSLVKTVAPMA